MVMTWTQVGAVITCRPLEWPPKVHQVRTFRLPSCLKEAPSIAQVTLGKSGALLNPNVILVSRNPKFDPSLVTGDHRVAQWVNKDKCLSLSLLRRLKVTVPPWALFNNSSPFRSGRFVINS